MMELNEPIHNEHEHASVSLKVLLLVFGIVLAAALGFMVYQQNNAVDDTDYSAPKVTKTEITAEETTATTTTDETADWKTYENKSLGFSFKYPADLKVSESSGSGSASFDQISVTGLSVVIDTTEMTLDEFIADQKSGKVLSAEQKTTLDGVAAYEAIAQGTINQYGVYAVNNSMSYVLTMTSGDKETLAANKAGLSSTQKLILASFKFTK